MSRALETLMVLLMLQPLGVPLHTPLVGQMAHLLKIRLVLGKEHIRLQSTTPMVAPLTQQLLWA